ncbi:MAG: electron transfer flavoprotein subunit beta/FixA family protein [Betaproteobacteria bacterium]|nr:electron transfer flavoprotein subunit beta/FixA family protein [Betaproteobacteria bacterium]
MKIVVCVKAIPDPEIAASIFRVDEAAKRMVPLPGTRSVMSPFDEQALELALRIRDALGEGSITLLTLGAETTRSIVKHGLSLGADDALMLVDPVFDDGDSYTTARALAAAIQRMGGVDLILTGRQAADGDCGVVGCGIAELLGLPAVTFAMDIVVTDGMLVIERALGEGSEIIEAPMPAVVTVSHEVGKVRYASLRETMKAARKPVTAWSAEQLGLDASELGTRGARRVLERLYVPVNDVQCEYMVGETPEELAGNLVERLHAARLI